MHRDIGFAGSSPPSAKRRVRALLAVSCIGVATAAGAEPAPGGDGRVPEPKIERIVVEDRDTRIEELRVRGQTQRIVVAPKHGAAPYEIIPGDASRSPSDGTQTSRGAAGRRVWQILSF